MDFACRQLSASALEPGEPARVFTVELTGHPRPSELDGAYEAIMLLGSDRGARIVVDITRLATKVAAAAMLAAAGEALAGRLTVTGADAPPRLLSSV